MGESKRERYFEWIILGIVFPVIATVLATSITGSWPKISSFLGFQPITPDKVLREDRVNLPVTGGAARHAADLDGGRIAPIGTSLSASDADFVARQTPHGIVLEPGLPKNDTDSFEARFTGVGDAPVGRGGFAKSSIASKVTNHLQLGSDMRAASHVCMFTTQGRLAEFEIIKVDPSPTKRQVEIKTIVVVLRQWYFETGGMFLTVKSREAYFALMDALKSLLDGESSIKDDQPLDNIVHETIRQKASDLRTSLVQDVGARRDSQLGGG